eukprot:TRINITY_DN46716_c0_g1_i1.p1 TRINITY_DN46716_c0_g1~~TRINITY_DN46716_c0_g1_i1.p1  ORF type:complete len:236 (-),score=47.10 TRINITY_DN46716_c0_g1_i1:125-832(-)
MIRQHFVRRFLVTAGGATTALLGVSRYQSIVRFHNRNSDEALGSLWGEAIDGMIDVPGAQELQSAERVLYLAPESTAGPHSPAVWPEIFVKGVIFSLTASNPMGKDAPAAVNRKANGELEEDIKSMFEGQFAVTPTTWWRSFGFNVQEGWREDGFSIAFSNKEQIAGRTMVLHLAQKYDQAAIYQFRFEDGTVVREVVWVARKSQEAHGGAKERMMVLRKAPAAKQAAKDWQQIE